MTFEKERKKERKRQGHNDILYRKVEQFERKRE